MRLTHSTQWDHPNMFLLLEMNWFYTHWILYNPKNARRWKLNSQNCSPGGETLVWLVGVIFNDCFTKLCHSEQTRNIWQLLQFQYIHVNILLVGNPLLFIILWLPIESVFQNSGLEPCGQAKRFDDLRWNAQTMSQLPRHPWSIPDQFSNSLCVFCFYILLGILLCLVILEFIMLDCSVF